MKTRPTLYWPLAVLLLANSAAAQTVSGSGPSPTVAPNPQVIWGSRDLTDGMPNVGRYASVAQTMTTCSTTQGNVTLRYACPLIGIAHYDTTNQDLLYSWSTDGGQTFTQVTVHARTGEDIGYDPALAYDGDMPVIAYRNATTDRLMIAAPVATLGTGNCGGANWYCRNIGYEGHYNAIDIHDDGRVVIAYYDSGQGISVQEASSAFGDFTRRSVALGTARAIDVAFDDLARVHVAWTTSSCVRYSYAYFEDDETVECGDALPVFGAGGVSLGLNNFHRPHIAYSQYTAASGYRIRRVYKTSAEAWQKETVSALTAAPQPGMSILMTEDHTGVDAIAWGTGTGGLRVARPATTTPWYTATGGFRGGAYANLIHFGSGRAVIHYDTARVRLVFSDDN